jgi:uncharacterized protein YjiS (DUF1127 family)
MSEGNMSTGLSTATISAADARSRITVRTRRLVAFLIGATASVLSNALAGRRRRQTERELSALSDTTLKDIGLSRSEIEFVARNLDKTYDSHAKH